MPISISTQAFLHLEYIYRYIEPLLGQLRLCRADVCVHSKRSYKPVPRALQPIDELFLVLVRLRLGLLEQDLAHRFFTAATVIPDM